MDINFELEDLKFVWDEEKAEINRKKPRYTYEEMKEIAKIELEKLKTMPEEKIDYSDIPALTDEELAKMKPARLRRKNLKIAS